MIFAENTAILFLIEYMEGPTLSKTQQEIATPKDCKQRISPIVSGTIALIFVSLIALGAIALGIILLSGNVVAALLTAIILSVAAAAVACVFMRENKLVVKIILDAVTGEIGLIIIIWFLCNMTSSNLVTNLIYAITTLAMTVLLICLNIIKVSTKENTRFSTKYITYAATFIALSVIFKMLGNTVSSIVIIPNMRLSFVYIPWVLSGIVLGPIGGVLTALISDVLGQLTIAVGGAVNPLTMLSNALFPLAPALLFKFAKRLPSWLKLLIGMLISMIVCTMGIGSAALFWQYEYYTSMNFFTYLFTIRWPQMIIIAINFVLCLAILPVIKRIKLGERLKRSE